MSFPFFFSSFVIFHLVTIDWSSICYTIITPRSDNEDNDHLWRLCNKVDLELFVKSYFIIRKFHFSLPSSVFLDIHLRFFFFLLLLFASGFLLPLWLSGGSSAPSPAAAHSENSELAVKKFNGSCDGSELLFALLQQSKYEFLIKFNDSTAATSELTRGLFGTWSSRPSIVRCVPDRGYCDRIVVPTTGASQSQSPPYLAQQSYNNSSSSWFSLALNVSPEMRANMSWTSFQFDDSLDIICPA